MATQEHHSALQWLAGVIGIGGPTGLFAALWGLNSSRAKHEAQITALEQRMSSGFADIKSHLMLQDEKREKLNETVQEIRVLIAGTQNRVIKP